MLISLRHRFLFISNMKAASTTIETTLAEFAELQRIYPTNSKHFSLPQMLHAFPAIFSHNDFLPSRFIRFGVIRDPKSWLLSWFNYRSRSELADPSHQQHDQFCGNMAFDEFAEAAVQRQPPPFAYIRRQSDILASQGPRDCNFIIRFEHFSADFQQLIDLMRLGRKCAIKIRNVTERIRLKVTDVDWRRHQALLDFLDDDFRLYNMLSADAATQIERCQEIANNNISDPPQFEAIEPLLRLYWQSYAASYLYGPTQGVSPEDLANRLASFDVEQLFLRPTP